MSAWRLLVTGSRDWPDDGSVGRALHAAWWNAGQPAEVVLVSGACPTGADMLAERVAPTLGWQVERHPAEWEAHGKAAGPLRNTLMVELGADVCVAFPLPDSRGTVDCMTKAAAAGIPVVKVVQQPEVLTLLLWPHAIDPP